MSPRPEPDQLLDHNYDGIQEYDNPMPKWWLWIFYATIVFAALYMLNIPGVGSGKGRIANYERDMADAREKFGERGAPGPALDDAALLALAGDPARVAAGKTTFVTTCAPCHREDGGGSIGPNLTDDYWLHGGRPSQLLKTVTEGVADKGMPAWGAVLKPDQVAAVVAYVTTLKGTHPPNPKDPQGTRADSTASAP